MPLDGDQRTGIGPLDGLDDAIGGPGHRAQARPQPVHRLMVHRVDPKMVLADDRRQPTPGLDVDNVDRLAVPVALAVQLARRPRQVLNQAAPRRHVEQLGAPAHRQDGKLRLRPDASRRDQGQLPPVTSGIDVVDLGRWLLAVQPRGHVTPARED